MAKNNKRINLNTAKQFSRMRLDKNGNVINHMKARDFSVESNNSTFQKTKFSSLVENYSQKENRYKREEKNLLIKEKYANQAFKNSFKRATRLNNNFNISSNIDDKKISVSLSEEYINTHSKEQIAKKQIKAQKLSEKLNEEQENAIKLQEKRNKVIERRNIHHETHHQISRAFWNEFYKNKLNSLSQKRKVVNSQINNLNKSLLKEKEFNILNNKINEINNNKFLTLSQKHQKIAELNLEILQKNGIGLNNTKKINSLYTQIFKSIQKKEKLEKQKDETFKRINSGKNIIQGSKYNYYVRAREWLYINNPFRKIITSLSVRFKNISVNTGRNIGNLFKNTKINKSISHAGKSVSNFVKPFLKPFNAVGRGFKQIAKAPNAIRKTVGKYTAKAAQALVKFFSSPIGIITLIFFIGIPIFTVALSNSFRDEIKTPVETVNSQTYFIQRFVKAQLGDNHASDAKMVRLDDESIDYSDSEYDANDFSGLESYIISTSDAIKEQTGGSEDEVNEADRTYSVDGRWFEGDTTLGKNISFIKKFRVQLPIKYPASILLGGSAIRKSLTEPSKYSETPDISEELSYCFNSEVNEDGKKYCSYILDDIVYPQNYYRDNRYQPIQNAFEYWLDHVEEEKQVLYAEYSDPFYAIKGRSYTADNFEYETTTGYTELSDTERNIPSQEVWSKNNNTTLFKEQMTTAGYDANLYEIGKEYLTDGTGDIQVLETHVSGSYDEWNLESPYANIENYKNWAFCQLIPQDDVEITSTLKHSVYSFNDVITTTSDKHIKVDRDFIENVDKTLESEDEETVNVTVDELYECKGILSLAWYPESSDYQVGAYTRLSDEEYKTVKSWEHWNHGYNGQKKSEANVLRAYNDNGPYTASDISYITEDTEIMAEGVTVTHEQLTSYSTAYSPFWNEGNEEWLEVGSNSNYRKKYHWVIKTPEKAYKELLTQYRYDLWKETINPLKLESLNENEIKNVSQEGNNILVYRSSDNKERKINIRMLHLAWADAYDEYTKGKNNLLPGNFYNNEQLARLVKVYETFSDYIEMIYPETVNLNGGAGRFIGGGIGDMLYNGEARDIMPVDALRNYWPSINAKVINGAAPDNCTAFVNWRFGEYYGTPYTSGGDGISVARNIVTSSNVKDSFFFTSNLSEVKAGSVISCGTGAPGHVGFVEEIGDGYIIISDGNIAFGGMGHGIRFNKKYDLQSFLASWQNATFAVPKKELINQKKKETGKTENTEKTNENVGKESKTKTLVGKIENMITGKTESEANAIKIYSVLREYGLSNEAIAGILGCWQAESNIIPLTIEGNPSNTLQLSQNRKLLSDYTRANIAAARKNPEGYTASDGLMVPGIGLAQWTAKRGVTFFEFAKQNNIDWYSLETQLMFFLSGADQPQNFFAEWSKYTGSNKTTVTQETNFFFWTTEMGYTSPARGSAEGKGKASKLIDSKWSKRISYAEDWYRKMKDWKVDKNYAKKVLDKAKIVKTGITQSNAFNFSSSTDNLETNGAQNINVIFKDPFTAERICTNNGAVWVKDKDREKLIEYINESDDENLKYRSEVLEYTGYCDYSNVQRVQNNLKMNASERAVQTKNSGKQISQ